MDENRKAAYFALLDVEDRRAYSNIVLNNDKFRSRLNSPAFATELVYGVLENKMLLDYLINILVPRGSEKLKSSVRVILRMGIYQLGYMNSIPEYAAVNESVNLAKRFCKGREGFVNACLRTYIREKDNLKIPSRDEDEVKYLSIKYSYEPWIIQMWLEQYDADFVEELLRAGNDKASFVIRANQLKISTEDLMKRIEAIGCHVEKGSIYDDALYVKNGSVLLENSMFEHGLFSIQDEASMLVVTVLDPQPEEFIMDVCAAPGGKAMAMAEKMKNKGKVLAGDIYIRKLGLVNKEAQRLGVRIVETRTWDATRVSDELIETADRVLVDAPCSGLGVVRRKPEIKYKKRTSEFEKLPEKQIQILSSSSKYVKPGGVLVYSTCTINQTENQDVVAKFLANNPDCVKEEAIQLMPNVNNTDGFFICKMKKKRN
jgi:16S rRNA (cytosine967-C5)-methyltransferase